MILAHIRSIDLRVRGDTQAGRRKLSGIQEFYSEISGTTISVIYRDFHIHAPIARNKSANFSSLPVQSRSGETGRYIEEFISDRCTQLPSSSSSFDFWKLGALWWVKMTVKTTWKCAINVYNWRGWVPFASIGLWSCLWSIHFGIVSIRVCEGHFILKAVGMRWLEANVIGETVGKSTRFSMMIQQITESMIAWYGIRCTMISALNLSSWLKNCVEEIVSNSAIFQIYRNRGMIALDSHLKWNSWDWSHWRLVIDSWRQSTAIDGFSNCYELQNTKLQTRVNWECPHAQYHNALGGGDKMNSKKLDDLLTGQTIWFESDAIWRFFKETARRLSKYCVNCQDFGVKCRFGKNLWLLLSQTTFSKIHLLKFTISQSPNSCHPLSITTRFFEYMHDFWRISSFSSN
jgi:hypothetical protein